MDVALIEVSLYVGLRFLQGMSVYFPIYRHIYGAGGCFLAIYVNLSDVVIELFARSSSLLRVKFP